MENGHMLREIGRIVAGAYYDHQEVRISAMNRIRDVVRKRNENIPFDKPEEKKEKKKKYSKEYNDTKIMELVTKMGENDKLTDDELGYLTKLIKTGTKESDLEKLYKGMMLSYVASEKIYKKFLGRIKGVGPVLSANLIKSFGYCRSLYTVSALWKVCGMHVVDGNAPKLKRGKKIKWSPKLRTLCWKISDSFVKQRTPYYRQLYDRRKRKELERTDDNKPKNKLHADLRARRYAIKRFLQHYWDCARELEGLERTKPWIMGQGRHEHYETWKDAVAKNEEARMP